MHSPYSAWTPHRLSAVSTPLILNRELTAPPDLPFTGSSLQSGHSWSPPVAAPPPRENTAPLAAAHPPLAAAPPIAVPPFARLIVSDPVNDPAVQNTVAMLPPSPPNTLQEFLYGVAKGEIEPAMSGASHDLRIDPRRYWEKRRVQNSLRRILESLQDLCGVESDPLAVNLGALAHDRLARAVGHPVGRGLGEAAFSRAMEAVGAWPPEFSAGDRSEVFAALRVPSCATVRALCTGQPLPRELPRRMLTEGLARIPNNLPDFPLPTHLLHRVGVDQVAEAIAEAFCLEQTGLERVKDFFLCGLLSLEEIQAALPFFVSDGVVEEAVKRIIRVGSAYFAPREWQTLVVTVQVIPAPEETLLASPAPPEAAQEAPERVRPEPTTPPKPRLQPGHAEAPAAPAFEPRHLGGGPPAQTAMTEPVPHRGVRDVQEPVKFACARRVVDWGTTRAGAPPEPVREEPERAVERAESPPPSNRAEDGAAHAEQWQAGVQQLNDPVRLISMDMHNECLGPFLALAFVRCCQLYDARRDYQESR